MYLHSKHLTRDAKCSLKRKSASGKVWTFEMENVCEPAFKLHFCFVHYKNGLLDIH